MSRPTVRTALAPLATPFALALALAAAVALSATPARAQAEWNQERVAGLAAELDDDVKELKVTVRRSPDQPIGGARRAQYEARDQLRVLQNLTQHLRNDLARGEDREATISTFRRIQQVRRDLEDIARKANLQAATVEKIVAAQDSLRQLAPYYVEEGQPAS